ncbi:MAG: universal stress protein [Desulfobulbaceae bacterium]|nr:universal stress protein [Desulfobulbaceae bacterium]HIJ89765.1 universal stress protein [Deltaproteobacteria bacterium]
MNEIKKILVPVDFSENSQKILGTAADFAAKFKAELAVVFVVQSFDDYSGFFVPHMPIIQLEEEMVKSAGEKMKSFVAETLTSSVPHTTAILSGDVVEEINRFAGAQNADLIVMGTHGYKGLDKILFGSVAEKIVKTAPCPVLTINPYR